MAVIRYHPVEIGDYTKGVRIGDSMKPMANAKPFILVIVIVPFLGTVLAIGLLWQRAVHWSDLALPTMLELRSFAKVDAVAAKPKVGQ